MATITELANEIEQTLEALKTKRLFHGKIGKLQTDNSVTLQAGLSDTNLVWVTLNDQTREVITALCLKVKKEINAPVIVGYNEYNRLEVLAVDSAPAMEAYGDATPTLYAPDRVGEFVNEIIAEKNTLPRVYPAVAGGLLVTVSPFDWDGGWWPGGDLTLTAPATASKKAWIVVCLKSSDNTLAQITGTEYSLAYTLTHTELAAVTITDTYIPLWGFVLANGQTTITGTTQNEPIRYRLGRKGGDTLSPWQTTANVVNLVTAGDTVNIGGTGALAKLAIDGDADEIQLLVQGHSTQTSLPFVVEKSTGVDQFTVNNDGGFVANEAGNDTDSRIEGDNDANLLYTDAGADRVGIGTSAPGAKHHIVGTIANDLVFKVTPHASQNQIIVIWEDPAGRDIIQFNQAGNFGIGTSPNASAIFHVSSPDNDKGSVPAPVLTTAQIAAISSPAEGLRAYDGDINIAKQYDTQRWRNVDARGWMPYAYPLAYNWPGTTAVVSNMAANGGSVAIPFMLNSHLLLQSVVYRNGNTSLERTWGWDLYVQYLNNGNAGENTLTRVAAGNANETFTPAAVTNRTIVAASAPAAADGPIYLGPGLYWLVIQNRHATNTLAIAGVAAPDTFAVDLVQTKTTTNPNGATLDFVAATWAKQVWIIQARLAGRVFGQTASF